MASRRSRWTILVVNFLLLGLLVGFWPRGKSRFVKDRAKATGSLQPRWLREYPKLQPAWPDQPKLQFDSAYQPVIHQELVLVASSRSDSVAALDVDSGEERWRFQADGPVRFAPVVWEGRAYFAADDGYLYCLDVETGQQHWRFRGGPAERKVLGNGRLISTWPARGAPVVADGVVYFAAGIWPFMGIFVHALDARTGQPIWTSDGDGSTFQEQPHYADAFGGVAPQGHLLLRGDRLLVPGGRSVPACYDRRTGQQLYYHLAEFGRSAGGFQVQANDRIFINGAMAFDLGTGQSLGVVGEPSLLIDDILVAANGSECKAYDVSSAGAEPVDPLERPGRRYAWRPWTAPLLGSVELPDARKVEHLFRRDDKLYVASGNRLYGTSWPLVGTRKATLLLEMDDVISHITASADRVLLSTRAGRLHCFGPELVDDCEHRWQPIRAAVTDSWTEKAGHILRTTGAHEGYCIAWGVGSGRLVMELARQSRLHIVVVETDAERVNSFRNELIEAGLYGERVAVLPGSWQSPELPAYLASLMVAEEFHSLEPTPECLRKVYGTLRPYGGTAWLPVEQRGDWESAIAQAKLERARWRLDDADLLLTRAGALPGSADWTHEHADAANTRVSKDRLVRAPLGLLWFGGPGHDGMLPRHGHGPQPQVIDGRAIVEGPDKLRAIDIYTGRLLWEISLPGVGEAFDNTFHQPGANGAGSNYVSTSDGIYIVYGKTCLRLDPASGKKIGQFRLPRFPGLAEPDWGYLNVSGAYLIGGANPPQRQVRAWDNTVATSKHLVVMDRYSGKVLWTATSQHGFRHNAVCIGKGRLYAIDRPTNDYWNRRGDSLSAIPRLTAFDLATGQSLWSTNRDVFGTFLSYAEPQDVLVESGRLGRDRLDDEADGVRAYRGAGGQVLWHEPDHAGPAMIHGDRILLQHSACDLRTGKLIARRDPLTDLDAPWGWSRGYGCNTPAASTHLLTFRSGAAGYFDLASDGGTGNLGGFRSGCTNNLIVAGGVLCAPDYTRSCTCSYQNQTSLALVPMADAEMWTYFGTQRLDAPIRRLGINLGAPGNRKAADGTLWLEYPHVGGPSYRLPITITPARPDWFRRHSSWVEAGELKWVTASGVRGLQSLTVRLAPPFDSSTTLEPDSVERHVTVRLHFLEPDDLPPGQRVFHVALQGQRVLESFDISKEAGGPRRGIVQEFRGVRVGRDLTVTLEPAKPGSVPVLCGIEVRAE